MLHGERDSGTSVVIQNGDEMFGLDEKEGRQVLATRRDVHVLSMDQAWIVTMTGQEEAIFDVPIEAEEYARALAREARSKLFIHNECGEIIKKECFAHDGRCRSLNSLLNPD